MQKPTSRDPVVVARFGGGTLMGRLIRLFTTRQFTVFLLVGGGAASLHWLARFALDPFVGYLAAMVFAYGIGIAAGYTLNAIYVFPSDGKQRSREITFFVAFNLAMLPVVLGVSWTLSEIVFPAMGFNWHAREIAHAIAVITPVFASFVFHKFVTFNRRSLYVRPK